MSRRHDNKQRSRDRHGLRRMLVHHAGCVVCWDFSVVVDVLQDDYAAAVDRPRVPRRFRGWEKLSVADPKDYSAKDRAREKQASRDEDARRLAAGEMTRERLAAKNSFLRADQVRIDLSKSKRLA